MDSFMETQYHGQNQQQQEQQSNTTNLLRFRSAPSSLLNDYITPTITKNSNNIMSYDGKPPLRLNLNNSHNGNYSSSGSSLSSSQLLLPPQYPKNLNRCNNSNSNQRSSSSLVADKTVSDETSCVGGVGFNLNRQCSSPAGFFNQLDAQNGYTVMRGRGNLRVGGGTNGEASSRPSRLSISHLPQIPEIGNENMKEISPLGLKFRNREDESGFDSSNGFPFWTGSGSEATHLTENDGITVRSNVLSHHLSLPKTSAEMAAVENLMHFPDMVPCKVRAKRGFATHPRSIAERVRRNRISERMRKLQDLVPNMDKQTNTADMLDLAVEYIKELQQQHKVLSHNRAKCSCGNKQHSRTH